MNFLFLQIYNLYIIKINVSQNLKLELNFVEPDSQVIIYFRTRINDGYFIHFFGVFIGNTMPTKFYLYKIKMYT